MKRLLIILTGFLAAVACAQDRPVYFITEEQLGSLADHPVPDRTYLVGEFMYLGVSEGLSVFCTFKLGAKRALSFGRTLISVAFRDGAPSNLSVGKAIAPNPHDPLSIISVTRSADGAFIFVRAEYKENI